METGRVVVVGASAGGVTALETLVQGLPPDFAAPVLIVLHMAPTQRPLLSRILSSVSALPVGDAVDGEALQPARIYVAVPDRHLMVNGDDIKVTCGPKENHCRPSIDVLFRSAAYHFGSRAIGVVLTGTLSDGSAGLLAIRHLGGLAVIQDPEEALYSEMPLNAMRRVDVDYALPLSELGTLLAAAVQEPSRPEPVDAAAYRADLRFEIDIAAGDSAYEKLIMEYGEPSVYTCPECNGVLFRITDTGKLDRFRCHTGHGFTTPALLAQLSETTEGRLWESLKCLQESSVLLQEAASRMREAGEVATAESLDRQAQELEKRLDQLRSLMLEQANSRGAG